MSEELRGLIAEQENICGMIVKTKVNFKKTPKARLTRGYVKTRKESLEDYWKQFSANNRILIKQATADDKVHFEYFKEDVYSACEEMFIDIKADMTDILEGSTPCTSSMSINPTLNTSDDVKLPKIDIAKFTGNYQDWSSFNDMFTSLIHNKKNLSSVQKMNYLKSYLSGEPAQLLDHLAVTETNYEIAWHTLQNRYNNKRVIVNSILNKLMNQKKIQSGTAKAIREILDTTMECLNKLNVQSINTDSWDTIIIHIIVEKLDTETHKEWEEEASALNLTELPTMSMFKKFLEKRFRVLEMMQPNQTLNMYKSTSRNINREPNFTVESKSFHVTPVIKCGFCKLNHPLYQCKEFQDLELEDKTDFVQNQQLCFNCLIPGHAVRFCKNKFSCQKCGRRHHTLLHKNTYQSKEKEHKKETIQERENKEFKRDRETKQEPKQETRSKKEIVTHLTTGSMTALLSTAQIYVTNNQGKQFILRALLDPCSQESFLSESAAQTMGLKRKHVNGHVSGIGQMSTPIRFAADIEISSRFNSEKRMSITTYIVKRVTSIMPSEKLVIDNWAHLRDLQLADSTYHQPGPIDILLGVDVYNEMIQPGLIKGVPGSPIALQTHLGWILSGRITVETEQEREEKPFMSMHLNIELNHMLKKFWELETIDEDTHKLTAEEMKVEELYEQTTTRDKDGRYIVNMPMRHEPPVLPSNSREIALNRWKSTEKRLKNKPQILEEYNIVLEEYVTLNHMKKIENKDIENGVYLPHHAVIKMERETSKVRVVYDASCKGSNGVSLNDELLTGPPLLEDLRAILIRWRTYKIAFVADVEKMYRQILVKDEHANYQKIVWRPDPKGPIEDFKLLTVTFGTSSAPYLAIKTLRQAAIDEGSDYPDAKKMILRDFYMDDLLSGTDEEDQAIEIQKQVTQILSAGGFPLKKWCSNSEEFMRALDRQQKREETQTVEIKRKESVKTFGIKWKVQKDKLLIPYYIKDSDDAPMTKRSVLSEIASIYDPMGWIAPSVIIAKIFMQKLWKKGISWDQELSEEMKREWMQYKRELPTLKDVSLDRWIHTKKKSTLELHGFADASASAYAAVIYARVINEEGEVKVSLVTAKTKISPIKTVSLPRLELLAATLLSKLLKQVSNVLEVHLNNVHAYSDSQVTLAWIHGDPMKWKPFVKNRVVEITDILDSNHWFYVNTKQNPADPASRGVMPTKLMSTEIWWNGPKMLKEKELRLEKGTPLETALEKKKNIVTLITSTANENEEQIVLLKRFSSLEKLTRVVAHCRRWLRVIGKEKDDLPSYLTYEERTDALMICIRISQEIEFSEEIEDLKKHRNLKPKSSLLALSPFLDKKNVLRVGGRLKHANMEFVRKHPIIISRNNVLLPLLLREAHAKTLHGPPQMMITYLRGKYWLINAANSVKRFVRECVICLRQSTKNREQKMGDLPESRVKPCRPFLITGVDFAGPINVRMSKGRGAKSYKAYICLFVCMCTKALHLELVSDMTTQAFLAAFKRFVSRRGYVSEMWSDHGTSFIGAEKELLEMWAQGKSSVPEEFTSMLDKEGTKWKYIPPGAPNFGGLWEAGVKSTKYHLKRIVGDTTLTFEELSTILAEIEACLNSRPLSPISDHPEDLDPLTPGHLLIGEPTVVIPSENLQEVRMNRLDRWQLTTRMVQDFWRRWQTEYLSRMQQRLKWKQSTREFQEGDLVLIKDQRLPPGRWPMGRVIKKYPGQDQLTRTYDLRTSSGVLRRSISKLCPLLCDVEK